MESDTKAQVAAPQRSAESCAKLRLDGIPAGHKMTGPVWTHPSVQALLEETSGADPFAAITERAQQRALQALEEGWGGPPYDPFELAAMWGVDVVARQNVDDARLVSDSSDMPPRIEFNPNRRADRVRFSLAHELAHMLFTDHGEQVRYRNESHHAERTDDWQLEVLCNVAAAEFLMPVGAIPPSEAEDLSLPHLLGLRPVFRVSTEALLRRVIRLTTRPAFMFAAARAADGSFRFDYLVRSRAARGLATIDHLSADSLLAECSAVGFSTDRTEQWGADEVFAQAVGIPPYPGSRYPRIVGLAQPAGATSAAGSVRYVRGDATKPQGTGPKIIAHVVNDRARAWGPHGFAASLGTRFPQARQAYSEWANHDDAHKLGSVHEVEVGDGLWVASLVAQAGYGEQQGRSRLRLVALRRCLESIAEIAASQNATLHMPAIGTGQAGAPWPPIRDLIIDELIDRDIDVTIYVPPESPMPEEQLPQMQLTLA